MVKSTRHPVFENAFAAVLRGEVEDDDCKAS